MYQKGTLPYIVPYLFTSSLFSFGVFRSVSPLPTRRGNSTGLAELWGGWPIERGIRVILNGQYRVWRGCGAGVARVRHGAEEGWRIQRTGQLEV
jgi:hypothetical protein